MNAPHAPGSAQTTPASPCPIPRAGLPRPSGILLIALLTLASIMIGLGVTAMSTPLPKPLGIVTEIVAFATLALLALHLWRACRTAKGIIPVLVLISLFLVYATESLVLAALLIALVFMLGEGSMVLAVLPRRQAVLLPLIPLAAYALTAALTRDLIGAAFCLLPFPATLALARGTRQSAEREDGLTRVGVICATSLTFGLTALALIDLLLYRRLGSLDSTVLLEALEAFRTACIDEIVALPMPDGVTDVVDFEKFTSPENAADIVNSALNLMPGCLVVLINLTVAIAQVIQHATLRAFGFGASITDRVKTFRMSLISCLVFVVACFMVLLGDSEISTLPGTVAQNIYLILLPGLALAGLLRIVASLARRGAGGFGCLFYLFILIPCLLFTAPVVLALIEVIGHIFSSITSRLKPPDDDPFGEA